MIEVMELDRTETSSSAAGEADKKEGWLLLGSPTFVDLGNGRLRCKETRHEFPAKDMDSYARTKSCRLALIDVALSRMQPPLNTFLPHPLSKSKLVCSLTGDVINKSEEHIWKHINGRRFMKKLDEKEAEMRQSPEKVEKDVKKSRRKSNINAISLYHQKAKAFMPREPEAESSDSEEPNIWIPVVGGHWDSDDGKASWESCTNYYEEAEANLGLGSQLKPKTFNRMLAANAEVEAVEGKV